MQLRIYRPHGNPSVPRGVDAEDQLLDHPPRLQFRTLWNWPEGIVASAPRAKRDRRIEILPAVSFDIYSLVVPGRKTQRKPTWPVVVSIAWAKRAAGR